MVKDSPLGLHKQGKSNKKTQKWKFTTIFALLALCFATWNISLGGSRFWMVSETGMAVARPDPLAAAQATSTTLIVERNDPVLHETATVMAMATGYPLRDYKRFVGSLRKTGFGGNIILAVAPDIGRAEEAYLTRHDVLLHKVRYVNCSHPVNAELAKKDKGELSEHERETVTCVHPYPRLKHRWARFPLLGDLLRDCGGQPDPEILCGGPVLVCDMRDTFFQRNPFGPDAPKVHGLQVFEEHYTMKTTNWVSDWPVFACKGIHYNQPMLCSGTTIGTRRAMLEYIDIFHKEMNAWMESDKCCCFETNADDQSMHNHLYYAGMLHGVAGGVQAVKNRNGLVHTVGVQAAMIFRAHVAQKTLLRKAQNHSAPQDAHMDNFDLEPLEPTDTKNWLGLHYGLTDEEGFFVDYDGTRSFVIHQFDRFGLKILDWLEANKEKIYLDEGKEEEKQQ